MYLLFWLAGIILCLGQFSEVAAVICWSCYSRILLVYYSLASFLTTKSNIKSLKEHVVSIIAAKFIGLGLQNCSVLLLTGYWRLVG